MMMLNESLLDEQQVSKEAESRILLLHTLLHDVKSLLELTPSDSKVLKHYVDMVRSIEFIMQLEWNFEADADCHAHWFQVPHCKCPKLDNLDRIGHIYNVYSADCKLHNKL